MDADAKRIVDSLSPRDKERLKAEVLKQLVEEFRKSRDSRDAAAALSASYLLYTVANEYAESCMEIMGRYHLNRKKVKTAANNLFQAFEVFNKELSSMVTDNGALCNDSSLLAEIVDVFVREHIEVVRGPYFGAKLFLPAKP